MNERALSGILKKINAREKKMKRTVGFILLVAMTAALLCGCGFNYDKEDLSKYVDLADYESFTFADF